jgi:hypothetical protein
MIDQILFLVDHVKGCERSSKQTALSLRFGMPEVEVSKEKTDD